MVSSIDGTFTQAAYLIIAAGFFDLFDGKIARATNSTSKFGVEFDSLADLVSFGVAPGVLVYLWVLKPLGRIGWLGAFLFLVCGALRLARFNVQVDTVNNDRFVGMPIPSGAGIIASTIIFLEHYADLFGAKENYAAIITILVYLLGILMVSNIRYRSLKKVTIKGKSPFKILVIASVILIIFALKPEIAFFAVGLSYLVLGLLEAIPGFSKKIFSFHTQQERHLNEIEQEEEIEEEEIEI